MLASVEPNLFMIVSAYGYASVLGPNVVLASQPHKRSTWTSVAGRNTRECAGVPTHTICPESRERRLEGYI